jgi:hypothetical protein
MLPGSPQHRDLFCRTFIDTHRPFEPEDLPWPALDAFYLERLRSFPLWGYARAIEQRAGRMVTAFADTLDDPLIREAVALQGVEETRHGRLMSYFLEHYGIEVPAVPITADPPAERDDFLTFGFGECNDSFVGFGAFAIAREKQLFPADFLAIFENVLWEEARHITFFINWWRYEKARAGGDGFVARGLESLKYHARAILGAAKGSQDGPQLPAISNAQIAAMLGGISPVRALEAALAENARHMSRIDPRLITPQLMPSIATIALIALRMLPPRTQTSGVARLAAPDSSLARSAA